MPFIFRSPFKQVSGSLTVANGGTGASNKTTAMENLAETTTITTAPVSSTGTITTASTDAVGIRYGYLVTVTGIVTITNNGTGSVRLELTLPYTAAKSCAGGYRNQVSGVGGVCWMDAASPLLRFTTDAAAYPVTTGDILMFSITFQV